MFAAQTVHSINIPSKYFPEISTKLFFLQTSATFNVQLSTVVCLNTDGVGNNVWIEEQVWWVADLIPLFDCLADFSQVCPELVHYFPSFWLEDVLNLEVPEALGSPLTENLGHDHHVKSCWLVGQHPQHVHFI